MWCMYFGLLPVAVSYTICEYIINFCSDHLSGDRVAYSHFRVIIAIPAAVLVIQCSPNMNIHRPTMSPLNVYYNLFFRHWQPL